MAKYIPLKKYGGIIKEEDYVTAEPKSLKYFGKCSDGATIWVTSIGQRLVREIMDWDVGNGENDI